MTKILIATVLILSFFVSSQSASAQIWPEPPTTSLPAICSPFYRNLYYGMMGDSDVVRLQAILISKGYLQIATPTGNFLSKTKTAVQVYQGVNGIPTTGYVGPITRGSLNAQYAPGSYPNCGGNGNTIPVAITNQYPNNITDMSAVVGGSYTNGPATMLSVQYGVVYSNLPITAFGTNSPTFLPIEGGGGIFTANLTNLTPNTTYYNKACAGNQYGTSC